MQGDIDRPVRKPAQARPVATDVIRQYHQSQINPPASPRRRPRRLNLRWTALAVIILVLVSVATYYFIKSRASSNSLPYPISAQTAGLLGYAIYYPNQKLLPPGYTLNRNSFYDSDQAILYTVSYGNNQKIVFSDQAKPSIGAIESFYQKNIPLNLTYQTNIGTATIGAIKNQTLVSLPTDTNAWLLITAPNDINQNQLNQVLKSIEIAK